MNDLPIFDAWDTALVVRFARDAYVRMQQDAACIEQLRQDNKDLSKLVRNFLLEKRDGAADNYD